MSPCKPVQTYDGYDFTSIAQSEQTSGNIWWYQLDYFKNHGAGLGGSWESIAYPGFQQLFRLLR